MSAYSLDLTFDVTGPLLTKSQDAARLGLDAHGLTDAGKAAIGGTHVRGHLKQALAGCRDLLQGEASKHAANIAELDALQALLGAECEHGDEPARTQLRFPALFVADRAGDKRTLHRIRIDADSGRVDDGALLILESPLAPGEVIGFSGRLHLDAATTLKPERICHWLQRALALVPSMGSAKSIGFGRIGNVRVVAAMPKPAAALALPSDRSQHRYGLRFRLDRPFCFASTHSRSDNRFESLPYVPGAALLGALLGHARRHPQNADCATVLELAPQLRFSHAHALRQDARDALPPAPVPHSWALADNALYDLAACDASATIQGEAPAFATDWKGTHWQKVAWFRARQADSSLDGDAAKTPGRVLTVRTKINHERNSAEGKHLFATDCVDPRGFDWCADISFGDATDPVRLLSALARVLPSALYGLGKTKAEAEGLSFVAAHLRETPPALRTGDRLALTLHSDAALPIDTRGIAATGAAEALHKSYAAVFERCSGGRLRLLRHFATQRFAGGNYLYHRFWKAADKCYRPSVLTEAGSVFVLTVARDDGLQAMLSEWLRLGLPVGSEIAKPGLAEWQLNPYRRGNGYGEVRLRKLTAQGPEMLHNFAKPSEAKP